MESVSVNIIKDHGRIRDIGFLKNIGFNTNYPNNIHLIEIDSNSDNKLFILVPRQKIYNKLINENYYMIRTPIVISPGNYNLQVEKVTINGRIVANLIFPDLEVSAFIKNNISKNIHKDSQYEEQDIINRMEHLHKELVKLSTKLANLRMDKNN